MGIVFLFFLFVFSFLTWVQGMNGTKDKGKKEDTQCPFILPTMSIICCPTELVKNKQQSPSITCKVNQTDSVETRSAPLS